MKPFMVLTLASSLFLSAGLSSADSRSVASSVSCRDLSSDVPDEVVLQGLGEATRMYLKETYLPACCYDCEEERPLLTLRLTDRHEYLQFMYWYLPLLLRTNTAEVLSTQRPYASSAALLGDFFYGCFDKVMFNGEDIDGEFRIGLGAVVCNCAGDCYYHSFPYSAGIVGLVVDLQEMFSQEDFFYFILDLITEVVSGHVGLRLFVQTLREDELVTLCGGLLLLQSELEKGRDRLKLFETKNQVLQKVVIRVAGEIELRAMHRRTILCEEREAAERLERQSASMAYNPRVPQLITRLEDYPNAESYWAKFLYLLSYIGLDAVRGGPSTYN
ncbi:MAG: hypothetical protein QG604_137 [Candidatus Dependentiae bacterium]|nr:hypothetical protein [Candidatus Dependentiae bacterium]